jgi:hypothetical protein
MQYRPQVFNMRQQGICILKAFAAMRKVAIKTETVIQPGSRADHCTYFWQIRRKSSALPAWI